MDTRLREVITHLLGHQAPPQPFIKPSTRKVEGAKLEDRFGWDASTVEVVSQQEADTSRARAHERAIDAFEQEYSKIPNEG